MKTRLLTGAMALALIGCSEKSSETLREAPAYDMAPVETAEVAPQTPSAARSPNIGVTSAPGVAFNYAYAFRIDDSRIAAEIGRAHGCKPDTTAQTESRLHSQS